MSLVSLVWSLSARGSSWYSFLLCLFCVQWLSLPQRRLDAVAFGTVPEASEGATWRLGRTAREGRHRGRPAFMGPLPNLIYYASVAKGTAIIAEYCGGSSELCDAASACLEKIPPFHSRFSHTAKRRMFNCLMNDSWVYCAIVDEALGKSKAYSYLEQVRDEFLKILKARGLPLDGEGLGAHSLDADFRSVLWHLAAPFVGVPQKEKDQVEEELRARQEAEEDLEVCSPSAVAPLYDTNDQNFVRRTEKKPSGSRSPFRSFTGKGSKRDKRKVKDQVKEVKEIMMENKGKSMDRGQKLEIIVAGSTPPTAGSQIQMSESPSREQQIAQWARKARLVLILDVVVCLVLFAIWLGICKGVSCVKKS